MEPVTSDLILDLVRESKSVEDFYNRAIAHGVKKPEDLVKGLEFQAYNMGKTLRTEPVKVLGLPAVKFRGADHTNAGYLKRTSEELAELLARKSRNKKLMMAGSLAALLGTGAYMAFSDKPEDKYKKEVDKLMNAHRLLTSN
ncbi:MAG: hypothetical protein WC279_10435 [Sulfurimonas sp.]|jgi:hypothetical protein|uniref:hypothetical protein n=1 Tax=Sulfurimonas sp. TaxID=2022749 RepID=UPI003563A113